MQKIPFKQFPPSVKRGIIFLFTAWGGFILVQFVMLGQLLFIHDTVGLFCCFMVYALRDMGRYFCVVVNILMIAFLVYLLTAMEQPHLLFLLLAGCNIVLFALATFFIMTRETAAFFKDRSGASGG
ncbi:MAG: hypothetical protein JXO48_10435 [Deltaproteobacteria bacterium]|nr:hypothetical protein [Deltaproteobacteria bacterium]